MELEFKERIVPEQEGGSEGEMAPRGAYRRGPDEEWLGAAPLLVSISLSR